ncbi:MAG: ankyrin repeat domain-containing protein [Myxococcota bacterium]
MHTFNEEASDHYFSGSPLLHYVAWNPWPSHREHGIVGDGELAMPDSMPQIARTLLDQGADPNAPNGRGHTVLDLLFTSQLASAAGQTRALAKVLIAAGASFSATVSAVRSALANHAPEAARFLIDEGVPWDLPAAAGLGELERLQAMVATTPPSAQELGLATLHAYVIGQPDAFEWLLTQAPDLDVIGVGNGTLLHRACAAGQLDLVERLLKLGADLNNRDNPFWATPLDWAEHGGQTDTVAWLIRHASHRLDLFQAAAYDLTSRIEAVLGDEPKAVHEVRRIWRYDAIQPLRVAVIRGHEAASRTLLARGAEAQHRGADGWTALDHANDHGNPTLIALLER